MEEDDKTITIDRDKLLALFYDIGEREDDPKNLDLEYIYGAKDILGWIWAGMGEPTSGMAATNSRLYELLTGN